MSTTTLLMLGVVANPVAVLEAVDQAALIADPAERERVLEEIGTRMIEAGRKWQPGATLGPIAEPESEPGPERVLSDPAPSLPEATDEIERAIDDAAGAAKSPELGYAALKAVWSKHQAAGTRWTERHVARAAHHRDDLQRRFAVAAVGEALGGKVA